jgi:hypothetical protein
MAAASGECVSYGTVIMDSCDFSMLVIPKQRTLAYAITHYLLLSHTAKVAQATGLPSSQVLSCLREPCSTLAKTVSHILHTTS